MLSSWGVEFEGINVEAEPAAAQEVKKLGVRLVPVVIDGVRVFHGWNPEGLAEFVGVEYLESPSLPAGELIRRLDRVLTATEQVLGPLTAEQLSFQVPNRDRTLRDLGYHIFRLSLACRDAFEQQRFPEAWLEETAPDEMYDAASLVEYGRAVREALAVWFQQGGVPEGSVSTYYGKQTAHQLIERTAWHAAQHLRQLYALLIEKGMGPNDPLTEEDFAGLPLPTEIW